MSDTVKLIIEIPKKDIEFIRKTSFVEDERTMFKQSPSDRQGTTMLFNLMDSVKNGTPLDDVKAEIAKIEIPEEVKTVDGCFAFCQALEIADIAIDRVVDKHIGKAERESE